MKNMKFRIEEEDRRESDIYFKSSVTPLTYRIEIKIEDDEIILKREYFYVGYSDGEHPESFYFDNEVGWRRDHYLGKASYLTRIFDPQHIQEKEDELIKMFYEKTFKNIEKINKRKKDAIKNFDNEINKLIECQNSNLFIKFKRADKLNKINLIE
jgi:hypothetical protein